MKLFTSKQIASIDRLTIEIKPINSIDLMERASLALAKRIAEIVPKSKKLDFIIGPGNNGGDGLAVARMLAEQGFACRVIIPAISEKLSADAEINLSRLLNLKNCEIINRVDSNELKKISFNDVIIDALFGSGLSREITGFAAVIIKQINSSSSFKISIDIPSGMLCEDNCNNDFECVVNSNVTLTLQFPKIAFFLSDYGIKTGKWEILPIGLCEKAITDIHSQYHYIEIDDIKKIINPRPIFSHKGTFGHALLIAGCQGMAGAAVLASKSSLKSGCGLLTSHVPFSLADIIHMSIPEAIVSKDKSKDFIADIPDLTKYTAVGIGPGLGTSPLSATALEKLIKSYNKPIVLDADALNIISQNANLLKLLPENSIITPHPVEFERLTQKSKNSFGRLQMQIEFSKKYKVFTVLKGAYTSITTPEGKCFFNSTGNPGMATAGSGDVLTGILLSLLAQKYSPLNACLIGVFVHGLAGDIAVKEFGEISLIASDIINNLGKAFITVQED